MKGYTDAEVRYVQAMYPVTWRLRMWWWRVKGGKHE